MGAPGQGHPIVLRKRQYPFTQRGFGPNNGRFRRIPVIIHSTLLTMGWPWSPGDIEHAEACGGRRLAAFNTSRGLAINASTARCGWSGERMDYNIAIEALCREAGYN